MSTEGSTASCSQVVLGSVTSSNMFRGTLSILISKPIVSAKTVAIRIPINAAGSKRSFFGATACQRMIQAIVTIPVNAAQ